jgi:hypothetical protein
MVESLEIHGGERWKKRGREAFHGLEEEKGLVKE